MKFTKHFTYPRHLSLCDNDAERFLSERGSVSTYLTKVKQI